MHGSSIVAFRATDVLLTQKSWKVHCCVAYSATKLEPISIKSYDEDKYCCRLTSLVLLIGGIVQDILSCNCFDIHVGTPHYVGDTLEHSLTVSITTMVLWWQIMLII